MRAPTILGQGGLERNFQAGREKKQSFVRHLEKTFVIFPLPDRIYVFQIFYVEFAAGKTISRGTEIPFTELDQRYKIYRRSTTGKLDRIPKDLKTNPGNNKYYFLPLLIGLVGMCWQYKRNNSGFWLVMVFFIMTGLAIIVYLKSISKSAKGARLCLFGSFDAFAIWIGIGFMFVL